MADINSLSGLTALNVLNMKNTPITNIDALSNLTNLEKLYLDNTYVERVALILSLPKLILCSFNGCERINVPSQQALHNLVARNRQSQGLPALDA